MKKKIFILSSLLLWTGCTILPVKTKEIIKNFESNNIIYNIKVLTSPGILPKGNIEIKPIFIPNISPLFPSFSIETNNTFKPGGDIQIEMPLSEKLFSLIFSGDKNQLTLCYFNFAQGSWGEITSQFDSSDSLLHAKISPLEKENMDTTLNRIFICLSFPAKEGLIANLFQQNKLIETRQGTLKNFFNNPAEKNCMIIHGVSSGPKNMNNLFKSIYNLKYYDNIIFYQYASGNEIKNNAEWLISLINKNNSDVQFDIIAHSMGGLVARFAIEQLKMDRNVNKLIMIGTPNNGGNLTEFIPVLFPKAARKLAETFPGVQDLITGSKFFQINKDYNKNDIHTKYYLIAGVINENLLVRTDMCVSVMSAAYLHLEHELGFEKDFTQGREIAAISGWKYYKKFSDKNGLNLLYEHSNLHLESSNNGVAEQISEWLNEKD
ncbi:alpha/beta hydrolase [Candidatus Desantisbacteria bacterium]|nr:alpha/beta hydrolase [Candidatus Desantisbacteria bacterium]